MSNTPSDAELDALIAEYRTRIYPQDMQPRFERAIMRAAIAKWGTPAPVEVEPVARLVTADSVQEDAARWRELREQHESDEDLCCVFAPNDMRECLVPVSRLPGGLDAFMDSERAARKQGANHD